MPLRIPVIIENCIILSKQNLKAKILKLSNVTFKIGTREITTIKFYRSLERYGELPQTSGVSLARWIFTTQEGRPQQVGKVEGFAEWFDEGDPDAIPIRVGLNCSIFCSISSTNVETCLVAPYSGY